MSIDKNQMELLKQLLSTKTSSLVSEIDNYRIGKCPDHPWSNGLSDILEAIGQNAEFLRIVMLHALQHYDLDVLQDVLDDAGCDHDESIAISDCDEELDDASTTWSALSKAEDFGLEHAKSHIAGQECALNLLVNEATDFDEDSEPTSGLERLVIAMAANPEMVHLFLMAASDHYELGELMESLVNASIQSDEAFDEELSEDFYAELEDAA